ncbi:MAG: GlsB/YeaQ/YmgE family stress response membrane protein [Solirubrobacterales bacterium]
MGIIGWIFLGLFAGLIARAIIPGETEPGGCIGTTAVGILGALIGGFIATALDIGRIEDFFDIGTWLIAIGGSLILLVIINAIARRA